MPEAIKSLLQSISPLDLDILLILGIALAGGTVGSRLFRIFKIPQAAGFLLLGILIGQLGFKLLPVEVMQKFAPLSYLALGLVGISLGGELKRSIPRKQRGQFGGILLFEAAGAFIFTFLLIFVPGMIFFGDVTAVLITALLLGSIAAAAAAPGSKELLEELKTKGPLTNTIHGLATFDDFIALSLFTVLSAVIAIFFSKSAGLADGFLIFSYNVGVAALLGACGGLVLARIMRAFPGEEKTLVFGLGAVLLLLGLSLVLQGNILITALVMGVIIARGVPGQSGTLISFLGRFTTPIYIIFFILAGALISPSGNELLLGLGLVLYLAARTAGKVIGARLGSRIAGVQSPVGKYLPYSLLSQSGMAVILGFLALQMFPGLIGNTVLTITAAVAFLTSIGARPLIQYALKKAGETGLNVTEEDIIRRLRAKDLLVSGTHAIRENTNLKKIFSLFSKHENSCYPVVDKDNRLLGVISTNSIKETVTVHELSDFLLAHDIMESPLITCTPETPLLEVEDTMRHLQLECLPVVREDNLLAGIIEKRSIQKLIATKLLDSKKENIKAAEARHGK